MPAEKQSVSILKAPWALEELPPYRPVARKLMGLISRDYVSLSQIEAVLRTDAAFTAQILHLANSAYFGSRARISGVLQAVAILGLDRIKAVAATLVLRGFLSPEHNSETLHRCWAHNLATALVCEKLARSAHLDSDVCYTAGLLHDIGRLALAWAHPEDYGHILALQPENGDELLFHEKSIFGLDHCEAGKWILEHWGFPADLCAVASLHESRPEPGAGGLLPVVYAGWQVADAMGFSVARRPAPSSSVCRETAGAIINDLGFQSRLSSPENLDELFESVAIRVNAIECSLI